MLKVTGDVMRASSVDLRYEIEKEAWRRFRSASERRWTPWSAWDKAELAFETSANRTRPLGNSRPWLRLRWLRPVVAGGRCSPCRHPDGCGLGTSQ